MRSALESIDGVEEVAIDFEHKTVTVGSDKEIDPEVMVEQLQEAGFDGAAK